MRKPACRKKEAGSKHDSASAGFEAHGFGKDGHSRDSLSEDTHSDGSLGKDSLHPPVKASHNSDAHYKHMHSKDGFVRANSLPAHELDGAHRQSSQSNDGTMKVDSHLAGHHTTAVHRQNRQGKGGFLLDGFKEDSIYKDSLMRSTSLRDGLLSDGLAREGQLSDGLLRDGVSRHGFLRAGLMRDGKGSISTGVHGRGRVPNKQPDR